MTLLNPGSAINSIKRKITNDSPAIYAVRHYLTLSRPAQPHTPPTSTQCHLDFTSSIRITYYVQQVVRPSRALSSRAIAFMHQRAHKSAGGQGFPPHGRYLCENQAINLNYTPVLRPEQQMKKAMTGQPWLLIPAPPSPPSPPSAPLVTGYWDTRSIVMMIRHPSNGLIKKEWQC